MKRSAIRGNQLALLVSLVILWSAPASAALSVSPIFGSHMVLQRDVPVPVFGTATPGATVTVQFQSQQVSVVAGPDGTWTVDLASMAASAAAETLTVTSDQVVSFTDVQVGEVWLCSGQSNMGRPLSSANGGSAAAAIAGNYNMRLFRMTGGNGPATSMWQPSTSSTAANFSAVCYWMGLEFVHTFGVPVGLIQATHDGTAISSWTHTNGGNGADYDAMISPLQPFAVKGVAWYQGESGEGSNPPYDVRLTGMIGEWRSDWGQVALPFGIVQLTWRPSGWTTIREGQLRVSETVADTFLVVTTDLPVSNALHPNEKKPVGIRLAIGARGAVYDESLEYSGPIRDRLSVSVSGNTVSIGFTHVGDGLLTSNNKAPGPFRIAGANGRFVNATATIIGNTIAVSSSVSVPKAIRYQWDYGVGNLQNDVTIFAEGGAILVNRLPASQFEIVLP